MKVQYQLLILMIVWMATCMKASAAIGCYVCSSVNGSDTACEDQFHAYPKAYQSSCMAARSNRRGLFPATTCIKFTAYSDNKRIVVRNCALYNGGITKDVEIGMLDHCGWIKDIKYDGENMKGCVLTCNTDGCNHATTLAPFSSLLLILIPASITMAVY